MAKAVAANSGMLVRPRATTMASRLTPAERRKSAINMVARKDQRSRSAPASGWTRNQGEYMAAVTAATAQGWRVTAAAASGTAARKAPSPREDTPTATHTRVSRAPDGSGAMADSVSGAAMRVLPALVPVQVSLPLARPSLNALHSWAVKRRTGPWPWSLESRTATQPSGPWAIWTQLPSLVLFRQSVNSSTGG